MREKKRETDCEEMDLNSRLKLLILLRRFSCLGCFLIHSIPSPSLTLSPCFSPLKLFSCIIVLCLRKEKKKKKKMNTTVFLLFTTFFVICLHDSHNTLLSLSSMILHSYRTFTSHLSFAFHFYQGQISFESSFLQMKMIMVMMLIGNNFEYSFESINKLPPSRRFFLLI